MNTQILVNPISRSIKKSIDHTVSKLKIAVPFISGFAKTIVDISKTNSIVDKRLVTRFDDCNISSFDLPTLKYLLDCGFRICYNNDIHLKLYITDDNTFVTSSNLTKGGFEDNIELTVSLDSDNAIRCEHIFEKLWLQSKENEITNHLLSQNIEKYEVLKRREKFKSKSPTEIKTDFNIGELNLEKLIDYIFNSKENDTRISQLSYEANKKRELIRSRILTGQFESSLYYSAKGHVNRYDNLYYVFVYGVESKLAGTGLREEQFKKCFEHDEFKNVINFLVPESIGLENWNLSNSKDLESFCNGLFDFRIPQYSEAIPIRLASYFYPEYFLPIFNLKHLQRACEALGMYTNAKTKGERFYAYNMFLQEKMNNIPFNNYVKSNIVYELLFSVELYKRILKGETYEAIIDTYKKQWMKYYIAKGKSFLEGSGTL